MGVVVDIKRTHLKLRMDPTAFKNVFWTVVSKMGKKCEFTGSSVDLILISNFPKLPKLKGLKLRENGVFGYWEISADKLPTFTSVSGN